MGVGMPLTSVELRLNRNELAFLLEKDPEVWRRAVLEEGRFNLVKKFIDDREELILKETWPRLVQAGVPLHFEMKEGDLEHILGPGIIRHLKVKTDAIIKNIDENVQTSFAVISALRDALLKIHPDRKFIRLRLPQSST
jgi:hypothetical protein